jgi:MOSC domain-containing protein YiiM
MTPAPEPAFRPAGQVLAVARDGEHRFSKQPMPEIALLEGLGVEGDAHAGVLVRHRSRVWADPTQPNLRQVHLIQAELFDELAPLGHDLAPGDLGENVTTRGIDLLALPRGALLRLGAAALIEVTGLRNPCAQIDAFQRGLLRRVLVREGDRMIRKTGVMAVVRAGGPVRPGDALALALPPLPHLPLERV